MTNRRSSVPFVNEKIGEDEKRKIDWSSFTFWSGDKVGLSRSPPGTWTIDRGRNVFFVSVRLGRPNGESPTYGLSWEGRFIRVTANGKWESSNGKGQGDGFWEIQTIEIPSDLLNLRANILTALEEAIEVYGFLYSREGIESIHITYG